MISENNGLFRLDCEKISYIFKISKYGHPEQLYFGARIAAADADALRVKRSAIFGTCVCYTEEEETYCLDNLCLEWSGCGRGDYRQSPFIAKMPDGTRCSDFVYEGHEIRPGSIEATAMPTAYGSEADCDTLILTLKDNTLNLTLRLYYTTYTGENVITRRAVLENTTDNPVSIEKMASMTIDLTNRDFSIVTFDGGWIKEGHRHERPVSDGVFLNCSTTGNSSNRHNPGLLLRRKNATEQQGEVYGFNLLYSGNHFTSVELSNQGLIRVQSGINPQNFEWLLAPGERFETPEATLTYSDEGVSGLSHNFHDFVNERIVRGKWKNAERPVLMNDWEACFFDFDRSKLLKLAKTAKDLGAELFVLDDGWFGARNSDKAGLGDYNVNSKLPRGLGDFAREINALGLRFGLWFEPEMVNEDSDLYRAHPDWAVRTPGRTTTMGRHQLVLDLCNPDVRDYIVKSVGGVLDSANIEYVKWDMNRHISDAYSPTLKNQGEFFHRYILGLYDILSRIFRPRPDILLESCASGGNRFDLGMLCFSPQIWTSDDTDPIERLDIQGGISCLYPPSAMGAHVSESPHQQTLRQTPLSTRFNVSAFGCLGYELDLTELSHAEKAEIARQIAFYKEHRRTLQYGRFDRLEPVKDNKAHWQATAQDGSEAVAGFFQTRAYASEGYDALPLTALDEGSVYSVDTVPQGLRIRRFGGLVKHVLPIKLDPEGTALRLADRTRMIDDCTEHYESSGGALMRGLRLNNQFMGSYYNKETRLLSDFGSNLYLIKKLPQEEQSDGKDR